MAFAEVGGGTQRATAIAQTDGADKAYPANITAGSLLICAGACWHATTAPTSIVVTDTLEGTAWTTLLGTVFGTFRSWIAYKVHPSSGACTVDVEPNGTSNTFSFGINEFSGSSIAASVNGGGSTGFSTAASDGLTTATANELIIGIMSHDNSTRALAADSPATQWSEDETNASDQCHNASFRIATTAGAYTMSWTITGAADWTAQTASFKETGGAAAASLLGGKWRRNQSIYVR